MRYHGHTSIKDLIGPNIMSLLTTTHAHVSKYCTEDEKKSISCSRYAAHISGHAGGGSFVLFDLVCLAKGLSSDFYVTVTFHLGKFLW